jgi:hypothetical protein
MSTGQVSGGWAVGKSTSYPKTRPHRINRARKTSQMKLTFKQRIRNWLMNDELEQDNVGHQTIESDRLSSDGMRLQVYKASGGYVIETRSYDRRTDRHNNTMHVINEDQDLGDALGKIVMMEALRG